MDWGFYDCQPGRGGVKERHAKYLALNPYILLYLHTFEQQPTRDTA
jgi:hypothetical protein